MIVDTSALLAILEQEPEAEHMARAIASDAGPSISSATLLEAGIVVQARRGDEGGRDLDLLIAKLGVTVVPFTPRQADLARKAYRSFGRGQHPAALNFGDCLAYALAKDTAEPLLAKGGDFQKTDLVLAGF
jgi:ribonuclease VapC